MCSVECSRSYKYYYYASQRILQGTHGLNEELGRHRGREGKTESSLCGNECENVSYVLSECSAYSSTRASFMKKLQELLEDNYEDFESLENVDKSYYVLGSALMSKFANKIHCPT